MNIAVKRLSGRRTDADMCKGIFRSEGRQLLVKEEDREKIQRRFLRKWK